MAEVWLRYKKNYKDYLNKKEIKFIEIHSKGWLDKHKNCWNLVGK